MYANSFRGLIVPKYTLFLFSFSFQIYLILITYIDQKSYDRERSTIDKKEGHSIAMRSNMQSEINPESRQSQQSIKINKYEINV
jgi:hypothetical protein